MFDGNETSRNAIVFLSNKRQFRKRIQSPMIALKF